jgi:hypothetical protein
VALVVFDEDGELLHHGTTRHRPAEPAVAQNSCFDTTKTGERACTCVRVDPGERRSTIELQLTPATLTELIDNPELAAGYEAVIKDIAAQVAEDQRANPPGKWSEVDDDGNLKHHGHTGRMPDATEAAFIRARDRSCRTPGCMVPARRCELDHRIEHANGGPSNRGCVDARYATTVRVTVESSRSANEDAPPSGPSPVDGTSKSLTPRTSSSPTRTEHGAAEEGGEAVGRRCSGGSGNLGREGAARCTG